MRSMCKHCVLLLSMCFTSGRCGSAAAQAQAAQVQVSEVSDVSSNVNNVNSPVVSKLCYLEPLLGKNSAFHFYYYSIISESLRSIINIKNQQ